LEFSFANNFCQFFMIDMIEKASDVRLNQTVIAPASQRGAQVSDGI
jgi:hypothetical protein